MILALSYCMIEGMSWTREMRPTPIAPTLMRLLGAYCPKTEEGRIVGTPIAALAATPVFTNLRLENLPLFIK